MIAKALTITYYDEILRQIRRSISTESGDLLFQ